MRDYLLFIDTEGSGLPKKWNLPYSATDNWPYSIQVSWIVYSKNGSLIKQQNHYINNNDFTISPSAFAIHGITHQFLETNGKSREEVMTILAADLTQYEPFVVGHFMELDARMIGADFFRAGKKNPMEQLPAFCTMRASAHLIQNPRVKYLRLTDLYQNLFNQTLDNEHNALTDATATAKCFFEMLRIGEINESETDKQVTYYKEPISIPEKGCGFIAAFFLLFIILTTFWL